MLRNSKIVLCHDDHTSILSIYHWFHRWQQLFVCVLFKYVDKTCEILNFSLLSLPGPVG